MIRYWRCSAGYAREEVEEDILHAQQQNYFDEFVKETYEEALGDCRAEYGNCCTIWLVQDGKLLWPI